MDDPDPSRRFSMLGYWSVSQRNILGMPKRAVAVAVEQPADLMPRPVVVDDDDDDDGDDGDDDATEAR